MKISVEDASDLSMRVLRALQFDEQGQRIITDHLIDSALRGEPSGLVPLLLLAKRREDRRAPEPIRVTHETPISAQIDGGDNIGLIAAHQAVSMAIEKALSHGVGIVGLNNTFTTGNLAYHVERATRQGLVAFAAGNGMPAVAPFGAAEPIIGTNPLAIGFPTSQDPIIWDVGASAITYGDVVNADRDGHALPAGVAVAPDGRDTTDPAAALKGALKAWGGHRGSGLGMMAQLFGMLVGTDVQPPFFRGFGFFFQAFQPSLLGAADEFLGKAAEFRLRVGKAKATDPSKPVRVPYDGSLASRERLRREGLDITEAVYRALVAITREEA